MGGGWGSDWNSKAYQLGIRVSRDRVEEAMEVDHRSAPVGALPRAHGGKGRCMRRALPFACHSLMALCFYRVQASPMSTSGCGLLTLVSSWSTAVPFPGLLSKPRIPAASSSHPPESPKTALVDTRLRLGHTGLLQGPFVQASLCPAAFSSAFSAAFSLHPNLPFCAI